MKKILLIVLTLAAIAVARLSVTISIPAASWDLCKAVWPARGMDVALGSHPRMITPSGDTVVTVAHDWTRGDRTRIAQMRADYGWPVVASRDSLTIVEVDP